MKAKNLILLMFALFMGMNALYANNTKVKKIKYAKNITYIGEAVKSDEGWMPKGQGALYIIVNYDETYTIEGTFAGMKVTDANLKSGRDIESSPTLSVFKGTLFFYFNENPSKKEGRDINLRFTSGELKVKVDNSIGVFGSPVEADNGIIPMSIPITTPLEYKLKLGGGNTYEEVLWLSKCGFIDDFFDLKEIDRLGLYTTKPYKAKVRGKLYLNLGKFSPEQRYQLVWDDGTKIEFQYKIDGNSMSIYYPLLKTRIRHYFSKYDSNYYYDYAFKDGTTFTEREEKPFYHSSKIDFGSTYYEGYFNIQGVNDCKTLAFKCKDLTREDIIFEKGRIYSKTDNSIIEEYVDGKTRAEREAEAQMRKLAEEEKWRQEQAKKEAEEQARKQKLTNKYGTRYANAILNREPLIGMTLEMLKEMNYEFELWGIMRSVSWQRTSKTNYNGVVLEHWEFLGYSVTLRNGKVIEINEE